MRQPVRDDVCWLVLVIDMDIYYKRIIDFYAANTIDELHDLLDEAKEDIAKANENHMRHGLASYKDAIETASRNFYNLQMVIRNRGVTQEQ